MPRVRGESLYRVSIAGAGREARFFSRAARQLQDELIAELRDLGREAHEVFVSAAPEDTGELRRKIVIVPFFRARRPQVEIRVLPLQGHEGEKRTGYDYIGVTRRGHRTSRIEPRQAVALKVHIEGHRNPSIAIWRAAVAGVGHPPLEFAPGLRREPGLRRRFRRQDWVEAAEPEIRVLTDHSATRLGRRIDARVLRG